MLAPWLLRRAQGGVEGLGPWGPVAFLLVVTLCEMVPLFPTQPLSLASGLLFGTVKVRAVPACTRAASAHDAPAHCACPPTQPARVRSCPCSRSCPTSAQGAVLMLIGVSMAAMGAFVIARGVGRPLAQKVIDWEMGHSKGQEGGERSSEGASSSGGMAAKMMEVQRTIEGGGMWQQVTAIFLLRLTPVVSVRACVRVGGWGGGRGGGGG